MKNNAKKKYIPGGSEKRFIEKGIHAGQKANEREIKQGLLKNVIRETRAKVQNDNPTASSSEVETKLGRKLEYGLLPYNPGPKPVSKRPPEENLVNLKEESEKERKRIKKKMRQRRRAA